MAQTACISACKHVAQQLIQSMLNPQVKGISQGAFNQLELDLMQCHCNYV